MGEQSKSIVFPTDFSEASAEALQWVQALAADMHAAVHCIYVVEEPQIFGSLEMGAVAIPTVEDLKGFATERLAKFAKEHLQGLGKIETAVLQGRPDKEIVAYADAHNATMIVMTTHGYSGVKHVLLGSTTEAVLRHANCPVLSVRAKS